VNQHSRLSVAVRHLRAAALAVLLVGAAYVLTIALRTVAPRTYFIQFVPAVMFSTWFGGLGAGLLASVLTVIAATSLLPRSELADQLVWLVVAGIVTVVTSALTARRHRAERELSASVIDERSRRHDAESLSDLKTDLLAQVAHELRQPLSALSVASRLLDSTQSDSARERATAVVARQTEHLRRIVDDLFDLSKLSRQELQLRKSDFDLCEIVDDSVQGIAPDLSARGVDLSSTIPPCPLYVHADATRVRQILSNLLANAVKFTPAGGKVDILVEQETSHIIVRVRDTGRGISSDALPHIFEMFHKGDGESPGLGVGLAVVKGLAEAHGGSVEVHSDGLERGSEFVVKLPVPAA
jgi:signal transduction histidine kinase